MYFQKLSRISLNYPWEGFPDDPSLILHSLTLLMIHEAPDICEPIVSSSEHSEGSAERGLNVPDTKDDCTIEDSSGYTSSSVGDKLDINNTLSNVTNKNETGTSDHDNRIGGHNSIGKSLI